MNTVKLITSIAFLGAASLSLVGCAQASQQKNNALSADVGYVNVHNLPVGAANINGIRLQALRQTAMRIGSEGALAWRSLHINQSLKQQVNYLSQVFNFNQLLLNKHVLPPVLVETVNDLHLASNDAFRISDKTYRIVQQAKFVTAAPNWRNYLWMNYKKPNMPNHVLLPHNQAQAKVWNYYLKKGWKEGLIQANNIFAANLNQLKRDYNGMVLYRNLLAQHMISAPYVATANLGVTGNSHVIHIGDRILRITAHSKLQTNSAKWLPVITN